MPSFKYKALNQERKLVTGVIDARTKDEATEILQEKGLTVASLSDGSAGSGFNISLDRISAKEIVVFSRQFAVLISANVSLVQSLYVLSEQMENMKFKAIVADVAGEIDGGARLSDSLARYPKVFSSFYVNVVKSGETSGKLDEILNYLADELEKDYDMNSKIKGAMMYPAFVLSGMCIVGVVMIIFVVPKMTEVLEQSGQELPMATKILIATSDFLAAYWALLLAAIPVGFFSIRAMMAMPTARRMMDIGILYLPIFGKLFQRIYLVRFTRSMETLLVGGVNISKGLTITADVVTNSVYRDLILKTKKRVEDGESISGAFAESKEVPKMVSQMLGIGEKTGKLDVILARITEFYTREIDNIVANLMTLMEPIIMVIMGIAVGIMVAAVMMPMYNMAGGA